MKKLKELTNENKQSILKWILNFQIKNNYKYEFPHIYLYHYNVENKSNLSLEIFNKIIDEYEKDLYIKQKKIIENLPYDINNISFNINNLGGKK